MAAPVTRFAPSPTGALHLGGAFAALMAWLPAQRGGRFLLRLEDIDAGRCRPHFSHSIVDDLRWLGLGWDGAVREQSRHMGDYRATLDRLAGMGLLYPCFCSRADIAAAGYAPHGPDGPIYPGTCRMVPPAVAAERIAAGQPYALRLRIAAAARQAGPLTMHEQGEGRLPCRPEAFGDVVLARRDTPASYHLCATHDDAAQGVTLVTRGCDLRPSADLHRLLQSLCGWPEPGYAHHRLLRGPGGERLSKRSGSPPVAALRERGLSPDAVRTMLMEHA